MSKNPVFESLKGFRDFYPEEIAARRQVFGVAREVARSFGYREVNGPSMESLDLFRVKSGDEVVEQTYSFTDKGGREVTLIPELTPTVGRMVAARGKTLPKPIKWFSWGKMWRYEQPQSGRLREFYQLNVDCFGSSRPEADAEVMTVAAEIMLALGLDGEFVLKVNSRNYMEALFESFGLPTNKMALAFSDLDKYGKITDSEVEARLLSRGIKQDKVTLLIESLRRPYEFSKGIFEGIDPFNIFSDRFESERLEKVGLLLAEDYGLEKYFIHDMSIVRGLDYYTDLVFECYDKKGELRSLFGGGRYDGVVEMFGGQPTPAVGFAMGDAVLEVLMRRTGKWPEPGFETDYYVIWVGEDQRGDCLKIARRLRDGGNVVETDVMGKDLKKQMSYANYIGAKKVLILGGEEKSKKIITVRDMSTSEQAEEPLSNYLGDVT